ncbi:MAG: hypothetical protein NAOJABEB_03133 [Steroidobacteraceae bacterium]|nr:hypothetical protein [Steroidobacteraceae bacterium]
MEQALASLESSGGYAILLGIVLIGLFYISLRWVEDQSKRTVAREEQMRAEYAARLDYEQRVTGVYQSMADRMITVVQGNTDALAGVLETNRSIIEALQRLEQHTVSVSPAPRRPHTRESNE